MIVCTSICANYLPKAMVMAKSLKLHHPDAIMVVCLLEKTITPQAAAFEYFNHIILAKDLGFADFHQHIFKHSIVEASTSVKGQLFLHLLASFPEETNFIYLDPDIKVMSPLNELESILETHQIMLTPHVCQPEEQLDDVVQNELSSLQHGVFNLGFLAIHRGSESQRFIEWWAKRLEMFCYDDIPNGIFTDQRWMDLAPCFFAIYILKHPGYNFARWNYSRRKLSLREDSYYVNDEPLRFIHFSGVEAGYNMAATKRYVPDEENPLYTLTEDYLSELKAMGEAELACIPWSYDYFTSGEKIQLESRRVFRENVALQSYAKEPFAESNASYAGILQEIAEEQWETLYHKLQSRTGKMNKELLTTMKFHLCCLKRRFKQTSVRYVIWGASNSGQITQEIVNDLLPNFHLEYYVDKYKTDTLGGYTVYSPGHLMENPADFVMIASSPGKNEIEKILQSSGYKLLQDYVYGYGVS